MRIVEPAGALVPDARIAMLVRAPLGYRLRCTLRIAEVDPGASLAADSDGDLTGRGRIEIAPHARGTRIRIDWDVTVRRPWMRALGPVLRPAFAGAHAAVMRAGERGLRRVLERDASGIRNPPNPGD